MSSSIFNSELLKMAQKLTKVHVPAEKDAFVPPGAMDPMMGGGGAPPMPPGGGGAPPMPPGGGGAPPMPPMDPAMMGGGGAPPPPPGDPAAGGGALPPELAAIIQAEVQKAMGGGAAGAMGGSGAGGMKPKIDVNVELMQLKNMMAKLMDTLNVQMPAQDMVATPEKLDQMAAGGDPSAGGGGEGAIGQIGGMGGMEPAGEPGPPKMGWDSNRMYDMKEQASAVSQVIARIQRNNLN